jgi:hypothetical protein
LEYAQEVADAWMTHHGLEVLFKLMGEYEHKQGRAAFAKLIRKCTDAERRLDSRASPADVNSTFHVASHAADTMKGVVEHLRQMAEHGEAPTLAELPAYPGVTFVRCACGVLLGNVGLSAEQIRDALLAPSAYEHVTGDGKTAVPAAAWGPGGAAWGVSPVKAAWTRGMSGVVAAPDAGGDVDLSR